MTASPNAFRPLIADELTQAQDAPLPETPANVPELGTSSLTPEQIVAAWENLYFSFPSPGLKKRVLEARDWAKNESGF